MTATTKILSVTPTGRTLTRPDGVTVVLCDVTAVTDDPAYVPRYGRRARPVTFRNTFQAWSDAPFLREVPYD